MLSIVDILKAVIEREEGTAKVYEAAINKVKDPASRSVLEKIMSDERSYLKMLEKLRTNGIGEFCPLKVEDLKIPKSFEFRDITESSTVRDVLIFSMKREQLAAYAYTTIGRDAPDPTVRRLFEFLSLEKLKHKQRMEVLYCDLVYTED